jgi:hypothetical protein
MELQHSSGAAVGEEEVAVAVERGPCRIGEPAAKRAPLPLV